MNTLYNTINFAASADATQARFDRARNSRLSKHGNRVLKVAKPGQIEREFEMLQRARAAGINVPHAIQIDDCTLSLQFIPNGQTLFDYIDHGKLTKGILEKVKRELIKFWNAGFVHGDLHCNNILINEETQEVFVIDLASSWDAKVMEESFGNEDFSEDIRKGILADREALQNSIKEAKA